MQVQKEASCGYYFYYPSGTEKKPYIVPSGHSCQNIREALAAMKNNVESERLQASIPENFLIREVAASGDLLIMRLDERAAITDDVDTIYTIEAILLTAKDFQFKRVRMENANIRRVGKFEFGKDWPVPVGPNLIRLEKKKTERPAAKLVDIFLHKRQENVQIIFNVFIRFCDFFPDRFILICRMFNGAVHFRVRTVLNTSLSTYVGRGD